MMRSRGLGELARPWTGTPTPYLCPVIPEPPVLAEPLIRLALPGTPRAAPDGGPRERAAPSPARCVRDAALAGETSEWLRGPSSTTDSLRLHFHQSRRAEYYADHLASQLAGKRALIRLLQELDSGLVEYSVLLVRQGRTPRSVLDELRYQHARRPARELERLRRLAASDEHIWDATHPPTGYRIRMLESCGEENPRVHLSVQRSARIDRELAHAAQERVESSLLRAAADAEFG